MKAVAGFVRFWYDFIVGDAWEVAVGVVVALALTWALVLGGWEVGAWVVLPAIIALALGGSLAWQARRSGR